MWFRCVSLVTDIQSHGIIRISMSKVEGLLMSILMQILKNQEHLLVLGSMGAIDISGKQLRQQTTNLIGLINDYGGPSKPQETK